LFGKRLKEVVVEALTLIKVEGGDGRREAVYLKDEEAVFGDN